MADIRYEINPTVSVDEFAGVLERSTLAERRPMADRRCLEGMLRGASLIVAAYDGGVMVGIARSLTDFHYSCYVSDLAVDVRLQRAGVGRGLIRRTKEQLNPTCRVVLLAAPQAIAYYPRLGFKQHPSAWVLEPGQSVR